MLYVCGITYVHTTNYGTCLQAYALQKAINSITLSDGEKCQHCYVPLWRCSGYFDSFNFLYWIYLQRFKSFQEKKIQYLECNNIYDLAKFNESYDVFICGSDVIWNPVFNHNMGLFYLDFAKKYKFSYAASFGKKDIDISSLKEVGNWIAELNEISVRELSSVEIVKKLSNRESHVIADPVVLLSSDEWNSLAGKKRNKSNYIFSYSTHDTYEYEMFLRQISKQTGLRVIKSTWAISMKNTIKKGIILIQTPEEWIQLIRDADYVVTNSFHATVFSSLFHKRFFTVVHGPINEGNNIRMYDYLNTTGLIDRMVSMVPEHIDLSDIDFSRADDVIESMRREGLCYLRDNLEAANELKKRSIN